MLTRLIYNLLFSIFSLFYLPFFILKGKARGGFGSRLGRVPDEVIQNLRGKKVIWIHAVSVGEVAMAMRLLNHWRGITKDAKFVLTVTTTAGYEVASKTKHAEDTLLHFPVDFRFAVARFIRAIGPRAVVIMETEIWPNLVWELSAKKIPIFILNGRISDRAMKKYKKIRFFLKPVLSLFTGIGAQDEGMRERFVALGAPADKTQVTGNLKFDWVPSGEMPIDVPAAVNGLKMPGAFLFLAASTHEGEDEILMDIYLKIRERVPHFRLLLVPRHLERLASIEALAARKGIRLKRVFSGSQNGYDEGSAEAWLLDRMGVLPPFYGAADAVFVGGSLVPVGGHNPVEPAYFSKAVLFGPHMNNFLDMSRIFVSRQAAAQVAGHEELEDRLLYLIQNEEERRRMGDRAGKLVADHRGALDGNTRFFLKYL